MYRAADIVEELKQRPFQPFRIHVTDGATYDVTHPDVVVVFTNRIHLLVPAKDQAGPIFERYDSVAIMHITRIEPLAQATTA